MAMAEDKPRWPGFWRRLLAYLIDAVLLGVTGYALGSLAFDQLAALGQSARLIGLAIAVVYFGVLSSGVGGSRTVGHRALGLKVVRLSGRPVGLLSSCGRAVILVAPWIMNNWAIATDNSIADEAFLVLALVAVFGIGLAQVYLLVFGGPDRRLVHDLAFGTMVIRADAAPASPPRPTAQRFVALAILAVSLVLALAGPEFAPNLIPASWNRALAGMTSVQQAVQALPEVVSASVQENSSSFWGTNGSQTTRTLVVDVRLNQWPADTKAELVRIARPVLASYRFAPDQRLAVRISYGFDLGIATSTESFTDTEDLGTWRAKVGGAPVTGKG
jgi:uncharacterized RDD family membrane protein YckC